MNLHRRTNLGRKRILRRKQTYLENEPRSKMNPTSRTNLHQKRTYFQERTNVENEPTSKTNRHQERICIQERTSVQPIPPPIHRPYFPFNPNPHSKHSTSIQPCYFPSHPTPHVTKTGNQIIWTYSIQPPPGAPKKTKTKFISQPSTPKPPFSQNLETSTI